MYTYILIYPNTIILVYYLYKPIFLGLILYSIPTLNGSILATVDNLSNGNAYI